MKLLKISLVFILCLLFSNSIFTQGRFKKAYIIDNNNQKISGSIDFGSPARNPEEIIFLDSTTLNISVYKPFEIQSFVVEAKVERRYKSKTVHITDYPDDMDDLRDLKSGGSPAIITETVFVEVLVAGKATLYHYRSSDKWDHFFAEKNGEFQTLLQEMTYYDNSLRKEILVLSKRYVSQLQTLFADCPQIIKRLESVENSIPALQNIFIDYNNCSKNENKFIKDRGQRKWEKQNRIIAVNLGYKKADLTIQDVMIPGRTFIKDMTFTPSNNLTIGLSFDVPITKKNDKLSFYNEVILIGFYAESNTLTYQDREEKVWVSTSAIHYSAALRYHLLGKDRKFSPFVNIGGNLDIMRNSSVTLESDYYFFPDLYESLLETRRFYPVGGFIGAGIRYNRFSVEFRMEYSNGFGNSNWIKTNISSSYLMLVYELAW